MNDKLPSEVFRFFLHELLHNTKIVVLCLLIGVLLDLFPVTVVFLFSFPTIRHYVGGLHANSHTSCLIVSITLFLFCLYLNAFLDAINTLFLATLCSQFLLHIGCYEHPNRILSIAQKKTFLLYARRIVLIFYFFGFSGCILFPTSLLYKMLLDVLIINGGTLMLNNFFKKISNAKIHSKLVNLLTAFVLVAGASAMNGVTCIWSYQPECTPEVQHYLDN